MNELTNTCVDCGRPTNGETCTLCGLSLCGQCIKDKKEILCNDCFYNDDAWMESDENYLDV